MAEIKLIKEFIIALFSEWRLLMTGLCLLLLFGAYEHYKQISFSWKAYCLILFATLLISVYLTWRTEHLHRLMLEDTKYPELAMELDSLMVATYLPTGEAAITAIVTIINRGAGSTFSLGNAKLIWPTGEEVACKKMASAPEDIKLPGAPGTPAVRLAYEDRLSKKSIGQPIAKNGGTYGWLMFIVPGFSKQQVDISGVYFEFSCFDVNGKSFSGRRQMGPAQSDTFIPVV